VSAYRPPLRGVLALARVQLAALPPDRRAAVDQNSEHLRRRLAALGLPLDAGLLAAFALGAAEVDRQARRLGEPVGEVALALVRAAAQLGSPLADPDQVAGLERALTTPAEGGCGAVSELLDVRVIGAPEVAAQAVARLAGLLELDRWRGPYPGRKTPGLVRCYLTGRLKPADAGELGRAPLAEIDARKAARDLGGELATIRGHWAAMEAQPWWPPRAGDVAIGHPTGDPGPYGETFLAQEYPLGLRFRSVSRTRGEYVPEDGSGIEDLWVAWPAISIVRAGTLYPPTRGRAAR
jgi:hypothetical protein